MTVSADVSDIAARLDTTTQRRTCKALGELLTDEAICPDGRLPSERELSQRLEVSRPTLRLVLRAMEQAGLVQSMGTRGRIVQQASEAATATGTAIILAPAPGDGSAPEGRPQPGWAHHTWLSAVAELHGRGQQALVVNPAQTAPSDLKHLAMDHPTGVIVIMLHDWIKRQGQADVLDDLRSAGVPVVLEALACDGPDFDTVDSDQQAGAAMLTRWLLSRGHRRVLRVWGPPAVEMLPNPNWLRARDAGYEQAMTEAGLEPLEALRVDPVGFSATGRRRWEQRVRYLAGHLVDVLRGPDAPDALMAISDGPYFALAAACRLLGLEPQKDIAIVGFDNYWQQLPERQWEPTVPLATVDKRNAEIGRKLVSLLLDRGEGSPAREPVHRLIRPELVTTGSAAPAGRTGM